jgi:hypothetical protein
VRSLREIRFRLRQELVNAARRWIPPRPRGLRAAPGAVLPAPGATLARLRGTAFAAEVERLAEEILAHRFRLLGLEVDLGEEIRWRRDPVRGLETPACYFRRIPYLDCGRAGDHKLIWELNRHQHLVVLAQAYRLSGRREFAEEIWRHVESWIKQNPFGRGINWASALEAGLRALSWIWVFHLAGEEMPAGLRGRFLTALYQHGCHLENNLSYYFSRNTHLVGEAVALHALGIFFRGWPRAAEWARTGAAVVRRELDYQVRADGAHFEHSSYYHLYALDFFLLHYLLSGRPAEYRPALARMAEYLEALLGPARRLPLLGDDDGGRVFHPYGEREEFGRATLATCARLFERKDWEGAPEDVYPQAAWWLGEEAWRPGGAGPRGPRRSRLFEEAGVAVLEAGPLQVIVDAGSFGGGRGGHSHSDTLSLVARCGAEELLVDAGTYTYVCEAHWRNWFRGSAAHNTVRVNRRDQAEAAGPFGWRHPPQVRVREWATSAERDFLDAECRYGGIVHRRRVLLWKPALVFVLDDVEGPEEETLVEQFWHPGEEITPAAGAWRAGGQAWLALGGGGRVTWGRGGEHGWRSRVFGAREEAPFLCVSARGRPPVSLGAVLALEGPPGGAHLRAEGEERWLRWEGAAAVEIRFGARGAPEVMKC